MRQLFRWGSYNRQAKAKYLAADPCLNITKPKPPKPRERYLNDREMAAFSHACGDIGWPWEHLFKLLLLLGQRRNETANMRWSQIDLDAKIWHIPASLAKNGKGHDVFLPPLALDILAAVPRFENGDLVFSLDGKGAVSGFSYAKARVARAMSAGLGGSTAPWSLHDLRRSFASGMARLKVAPHIADRCLNHQTGTLSAIALIYNRYEYADERREAHRVWADHIARITGENIVRLTA